MRVRSLLRLVGKAKWLRVRMVKFCETAALPGPGVQAHAIPEPTHRSKSFNSFKLTDTTFFSDFLSIGSILASVHQTISALI